MHYNAVPNLVDTKAPIVLSNTLSTRINVTMKRLLCCRLQTMCKMSSLCAILCS